MSEVCSCTQPGFCERRQCLMSGVHFRRCQAGEVAKLDELYANKLEPVVPTEKSSRVIVAKPGKETREKPAAESAELVGTALKSRIEKLITIKTGQGCGCQNLAAQMDAWGIAGCQQRREQIVGHLVGNRAILVEALKSHGTLGHAAGLAVEFIPEIVLRAGAGVLLDGAIDDVRARLRKNAQHTQRGSGSRTPYDGWRSEADGPVIPLGPFVSSVRHLTYFVYPKTEESWQWNLQQLAKRWWLFNGTRVLGIAFDKSSANPEAVVEFAASLGMNFDHVLTAPNNTKIREVVLFVPMLRLLNPETAGPDEVVFSAHAKGQKYDDPKHTRDWCDLMYRSCLDDWPSVYNALRTALMAGAFREFGLLGKWHNWAFSGSFYFFRLAEIGKRKWSDVDQWFAGTESWPGKLCDPRETACLFLNNSTNLYIREYWESTVWPEWAKYQERLRGR